MNEQEYRSKREEILAKFTKEFKADERYYADSYFRTCMELMIRGDNPYNVIEALIKGRMEMIDHTLELVKNSMSIRIVAKEK